MTTKFRKFSGGSGNGWVFPRGRPALSRTRLQHREGLGQHHRYVRRGVLGDGQVVVRCLSVHASPIERLIIFLKSHCIATFRSSAYFTASASITKGGFLFLSSSSAAMRVRIVSIVSANFVL